jgi:ESCRT-I complex subunit VPS28
LKLDLHAVDQIYPLLNDLYESLCKISSLPPDWKGKVDIKKWLTEMSNMSASDELSPEQVRFFCFV